MATEYFNQAGAAGDDDMDYEDEGFSNDDGLDGGEEEVDPSLKNKIEDPFEILYEHHPETILDYAETIMPAVPLKVAPPLQSEVDKDPEHTSLPFLTIYERTKILGMRANQIAEGAKIYIDRPDHVIQPLEIAKLELEQRRLPFIVKRPMPDGTFEYWRLSDLMVI
jgi:DNA-directed RNA polymerase I, II, and III subunit RPABC2